MGLGKEKLGSLSPYRSFFPQLTFFYYPYRCIPKKITPILIASHPAAAVFRVYYPNDVL